MTTADPRPNSLEAIIDRLSTGRVGAAAPWVMLLSRLVLFTVFQSAFALVFLMLGEEHAWDSSVAWWPVSATLANLVNIALLMKLARAEGLRLRDVYGFNRATWKADLAWAMATVLAAAPLAIFPVSMLAVALWGDPAAPNATMFQVLPMWGAVLTVGFPLTIALAETPTYNGYVLPRLRAMTGSRWGMLLLVAFVGAAQHIAVPLVFDLKFVVWRLLMFVPFSLFWVWALDRRPTMMPFMMVVHGLLDASIAVTMILMAMGVAIQ